MAKSRKSKKEQESMEEIIDDIEANPVKPKRGKKKAPVEEEILSDLEIDEEPQPRRKAKSDWNEEPDFKRKRESASTKALAEEDPTRGRERERERQPPPQRRNVVLDVDEEVAAVLSGIPTMVLLSHLFHRGNSEEEPNSQLKFGALDLIKELKGVPNGPRGGSKSRRNFTQRRSEFDDRLGEPVGKRSHSKTTRNRPNDLYS